MASPRSRAWDSGDGAELDCRGLANASGRWDLDPAIRQALRAELGEWFGGRSRFLDLLRQELRSAVEDWHRHLASSHRAAHPAAGGLPSAEGGGDPAAMSDPSQAGATPQAVSPVKGDSRGAEGDVCDAARTSEVGSSPSFWEDGSSPKSETSIKASCDKMFTATSDSSEVVARVTRHFHEVSRPSVPNESDDEDDERRNMSLAMRALSVRFGEASSSVDPMPATSPLARAVSSEHFETFIRITILLNCAFMVHLANEGIRDWQGPPSSEIIILETLFLTIYTFEIVMKIVVHRCFYFASAINCFDFLLVCVDLWDVTVRYMQSENVLDASYLRALRFLKLGKALRAVQVMRGLEKLHAFLVCIQGSMGSLLWSLVLLAIVLYMFSLCIVQIVAEHFRDAGNDISMEDRKEFCVWFGSVQLSMLTLFQMTTNGISWREPFRLLMQTGWVGVSVFLGFICFAQLAVINIITGIFVESAMSNLAPDRDTMALEHHFQEQQAAKKLLALCKEEDAQNRGALSIDQFDAMLQAGKLPRLLGLMGLRKQHARQFFLLLAGWSRTGEVEILKFVTGCMRLKGAATSFDLHMLTVDIHGIRQSIKEVKRQIRPAGQAADLADSGNRGSLPRVGVGRSSTDGQPSLGTSLSFAIPENRVTVV